MDCGACILPIIIEFGRMLPCLFVEEIDNVADETPSTAAIAELSCKYRYYTFFVSKADIEKVMQYEC